jgi:hypothetical protein
MNIISIIKSPATKAVLVSPELLIGLAVLGSIILGGNEFLIKPLSTGGTEMDGKITVLKTEVSQKKQFAETLKSLQKLGAETNVSFLTLSNPEFLSIELFKYIQTVQKKIKQNPLSLPAPHNQIMLLSLEEATATATPPVPGATVDGSGRAKLNLNDKTNTPFPFPESDSLKEGKLDAYTTDYTLKAQGTYAGLLGLLNSLVNSTTAISVQSLNFSLDAKAPQLVTLRPGANLIPPPNTSSTNTIDGSLGAESGSGGGGSLLTLGTVGADAAAEKLTVEQTTTTGKGRVQLPPSAAPVIMTLNFRVYVKAATTSPNATTTMPPSAAPAF